MSHGGWQRLTGPWLDRRLSRLCLWPHQAVRSAIGPDVRIAQRRSRRRIPRHQIQVTNLVRLHSANLPDCVNLSGRLRNDGLMHGLEVMRLPGVLLQISLSGGKACSGSRRRVSGDYLPLPGLARGMYRLTSDRRDRLASGRYRRSQHGSLSRPESRQLGGTNGRARLAD